MAITYAYPTVAPASQDLLVGTEISVGGGADAPKTRTFTVGSVVTLATDVAAVSAANLYAAKAGATFTGTITAPTIIKTGGTPFQMLRADGSISTSGTLSKYVNTTIATTAGTTTVASTEIPRNIFSDGDLLLINASMSLPPPATGPVTAISIVFYINNTPDLVNTGSLQQIAGYTIPVTAVGSAIRYVGIDRSFWFSNNIFYGRDFTASATQQSGASVNYINNTSTLPASFYIVTTYTTTLTDRLTFNSLVVRKS